MAHNYNFRNYWGTRYTMTVDAPIRAHKHAACGVNMDDRGTHLISYATEVCTITPDGWLKVNGLFSATTRKHIGWFLREYAQGTSYDAAKYAYEHNCEYNLNTGEMRTLYQLPENP